MSAISKIELTAVKPVSIPAFELDERANGEEVSELARSDHRWGARAQVSMTGDELLLRNISERASGYRGER